jgi:hypothetical protein
MVSRSTGQAMTRCNSAIHSTGSGASGLGHLDVHKVALINVRFSTVLGTQPSLQERAFFIKVAGFPEAVG